MNEILKNLIEVTLAKNEDFLKIKETLERIGVASKKDKKLFQSCHIFHKQGRYYLVHFKEMFLLDGKPSEFTDDDKGRRNKIATLLEEWGLLKIVDKEAVQTPMSTMTQIKIISYNEKDQWELISKYSIGKKK